MSELMRTHRALCTPFVSEDLFRRAFGAGRANIGTVARYLSTPVPDRPMLSFYFDTAFYLDANPDVAEAGIDPLLHFIETGILEERAPHPLVDIKYILSQDSGLLGSPPQIELLVDLLEYDLAIPSPYFDPATGRASRAGHRDFSPGGNKARGRFAGPGFGDGNVRSAASPARTASLRPASATRFRYSAGSSARQ